MPSGSHAPEPVASLASGTPNSTTAGTPTALMRLASATSDATVCWKCPGMDAMGTGASMPARTNKGATKSSGDNEVSATMRRSA